ncbi:MAG: hypothetical protein Q7S84_00425 [bacterium]|nr:hypothetical protein [bacterium]
MTYYSFIKDLITFLFTLAGLIIAGIGLATWKKQIKGLKEFEAAYDLHFSILKLRDAIKHVRNPAIFPFESLKAVQYAKTKYPEKSDSEMEKDSHLYVYEMRWEEINNARREMESHLLAIEVLWGSEISILIKPLYGKISELYLGLKQNFQPTEFKTRSLTEIHDIIYDKSNWDTEDTFSGEVSRLVQKITEYIKGKIS